MGVFARLTAIISCMLFVDLSNAQGQRVHDVEMNPSCRTVYCTSSLPPQSSILNLCMYKITALFCQAIPPARPPPPRQKRRNPPIATTMVAGNYEYYLVPCTW